MRPSRTTAASGARRAPPAAARRRAMHGRDAQLRRRRGRARTRARLRRLARRRARRRAAPEDDDVAAGDQFGAGIHVADDDDVADVMQRLAAAQRADVVERRRGGASTAGRRRRRSRRDGRRLRLRFGPADACLAALAALRDVGAGAGEIGDQRTGGLRQLGFGEIRVARRSQRPAALGSPTGPAASNAGRSLGGRLRRARTGERVAASMPASARRSCSARPPRQVEREAPKFAVAETPR